MLTSQEQARYREQLRNAQDEQARIRLREQQQQIVRDRARMLGVPAPEPLYGQQLMRSSSNTACRLPRTSERARGFRTSTALRCSSARASTKCRSTSLIRRADTRDMALAASMLLAASLAGSDTAFADGDFRLYAGIEHTTCDYGGTEEIRRTNGRWRVRGYVIKRAPIGAPGCRCVQTSDGAHFA
jgi:hypothetical protein